MPERATRCADERAALDAFCARIAAFDPDVLTGWNTIDFDLTVLAAHRRAPAPSFQPRPRRRARSASARPRATSAAARRAMPGRLVLDGIDLLRGAFVRMDDYSLDAVAREVLGEGKARGERATCARPHRRDPAQLSRTISPAFALYARTDARLAYQIVERLNLIPLAFARSALDRHDAGPRRGEHRVVRLPVSERARAPGHRRADRALRRLARVTPRSRAGMCSSP